MRYLTIIFVAIIIFSGCKKDEGINVFSLQDDKDLGLQFRNEILNTPDQYPILKENVKPEAYTYVRNIVNTILNSGEVTYKDEFAWEVYIIEDDENLNAFATPGGYIYLYTGLMKTLRNEAELAGVIGHEIAHADKRHSTEQLTKQHGLTVLFDLLLGNNQGLLTEIAGSLVSLKNSRSHEEAADTYSVNYLCPTEYKADGAAGFFEILIAQGSTGETPQFLSTHPNPENRVENINAYAIEKGCTGEVERTAKYQEFLDILP